MKNNTVCIFFITDMVAMVTKLLNHRWLGCMPHSLWMIIGMLLMSTITAQISSSITADGLRPLNDMFGSKV